MSCSSVFPVHQIIIIQDSCLCHPFVSESLFSFSAVVCSDSVHCGLCLLSLVLVGSRQATSEVAHQRTCEHIIGLRKICIVTVVICWIA